MAGRVRANGEGSIYPYRTGFAAYVWVRTPVGTMKRKYVYGKRREIVHEKWLKLHQQAREGPVATRVPKVREYLEYWLTEVIKPNRSPRTYGNYESFVRLYITPGVGEKRLDRLQLGDAQLWINKVAKSCQCCIQGKDAQRSEKKWRCCAIGQCCKDAPSPRTIRDIRDCLRGALNQAIKDELIGRNVAALVTLPAVRRRKGKHWSSEEARAFLESAQRDGDPLYPAYVLVLVLGLRKGEVLGLRWDDVDFDVAELMIEWQLQRVGRQLLHRPATKSAASSDTLPLIDLCFTALQERQKGQEATRVAAGTTWQRSPLVFTGPLGTPIDPRNFNRSWERRIVRAGVPRITVHDGRRTCATLLVDLDVHPRQIMRILRHAQFSVTMEIYAQASSKATREALKRLGASLHD